MDLDVVRVKPGVQVPGHDSECFTDDEGEWHEHRLHYGYPADVVCQLPELAATLLMAVVASTAPYDEATGARWTSVLYQPTGR